METLLSALDTTVTGGIFGLIGSFLTKLMGLAKSKQDLKHELAAQENDRKLMETEARIAQENARLEIERNGQMLRKDAYADSLKHDSVALDVFGSAWLMGAEFIRRTYRPFITTLLIVLFGLIFFGDDTTDAMRLDMVKAIIHTTIMAVTWWFADRSFNKSVG